jgi:hypothetical protein
MDRKEICVVIPIYKDVLNDFEIQSVEQCMKTLSDYCIYFIAPKGLDLNFYRSNFKSINNFVYFDKSYFIDIVGYSRLLLNIDFYKKFDQFKYMLVYQTDCYVFKDELLEWAGKDYDYIGGVWFDNYTDNPFLGAKLWQAGNGGFSLRKIKSIARLLSSKRPIKKWNQLYKEAIALQKNGKKSFLKALLLLPFSVFGFRNNYKYLATSYKFNEDGFFIEASSKYHALKIPNVEEAIGFSWDMHPRFLYEKFGKLPLGCHAWYRNDFPYEENKAFWLDKIKKDND